MKRLLIFALFISYSCSDSPSEPVLEKELFHIYDYQYAKNKFFFVDDYYRNRYESAFSEDLLIFRTEIGKKLSQVYLWSKVSSSKESYQCVASIEPEYYKHFDFDSIEQVEGQVEKGYFRLLNGYEYNIDYFRGFIWLNQPMNDFSTLGISYIQDDGTKVGTVIGDDFNNVHIKLLKASMQDPSYTYTWPLMMKNAYDILDSLRRDDQDIHNIEIKHFLRDKKDSAGNFYLYLLGFDVLDKYFSPLENGDGQFDGNGFFLDQANGILMFPGLQPFDPLEGSRFPLREEDRVDMYNTTNKTQRQSESRFQISLVVKN